MSDHLKHSASGHLMHNAAGHLVRACGGTSTDPCADGCCTLLMARVINNPPSLVLDLTGNHFTAGVSDLYADADNLAVCPSVNPITRGGDGKWQWVLEAGEGTLTSTRADLNCPPNGTASWILNTTANILEYVVCATDPELPDTRSTLLLGNLLANFTGNYTGTTIPTNPTWSGLLRFDPSGTPAWRAWAYNGTAWGFTSYVAIETNVPGTFVDFASFQVIIGPTTMGIVPIPVAVTVGLNIQGYGNAWERWGGAWYGTIPLGDNGQMTSGPWSLEMGYAPPDVTPPDYALGTALGFGGLGF